MKEDNVRKSILLGKMNYNTENSASTYRVASVPLGKRAHAIPIFYLLVIITTLLSTTSWGANSLSQFGITWTFDKELSLDGAGDTYHYGQFANDDYWVVGPVTIIGIDPLSTEIDGRIKNGTMLNPDPAKGKQGYDNSMLYNTYDSSLNVALNVNASSPLIVSPGSSLISTISEEQAGFKYAQLKVAAVLTVLSSAPAVDSFRPPYCGSDKTIKFNKSDLNYDKLADLTAVAETPTLHKDVLDDETDQDETVERMFQRPWIDHKAGYTSREQHPSENMPDYGTYMAQQIGVGALMLNLDYTDEQKEPLLVGYVQLGIDLYGVVSNGGITNFTNDGGHQAGRKMPILLAGVVLNDTDMKNVGVKSGDYLYTTHPDSVPEDYIHFQEDDQTFYAKEVDIYSQPYTLNGHGGVGAYTIGTVKVTNGSAVIEGVGTSWSANVTAGHYFGVENDAEAYNIDGKAYLIDSVDSDTQITLNVVYRGDTDITGDATYKIQAALYYGHGAGALGADWTEFVNTDVDLPCWGLVHSTYPSRSGPQWAKGYQIANAQVWGGLLAAWIVSDIKTLWNHDALFDYMDRHMDNYEQGTSSRQLDPFLENMWDAYRANYGDVWTAGTTQYDLTISSTDGGSVTTPGQGQYSYDANSVVSIHATADSNYHFVNWTGTAVAASKVADVNSASTTVTVDANYTVVANFAIDEHTLTISSTAGGSVTTPGEGASQYDNGTEVSIQATAESNYDFVSWTGTAVTAGKVANASSAITTVTADANYSLIANFSVTQRTLTASSTAGGSVTTPAEGASQHNHGTELSIQATAEDNYHFVNWTGTAVTAGKVASAGSASTTVTMDADYTLVANFTIDEHALTASSTAGGSVTTPGEGAFQYDHGTDVSILATAETNYHFVNWTGTAVDAGDVANTSSASTTVTMDLDYTLVANFAIDEHTITVSSTTGGSVTTPGEGTFQYDHDTDVSIQATPDDEYYFSNWTGTAVDAGKVANANTASTTVTADADYTVVANFSENDELAPIVSNLSPEAGSIQNSLNTLVYLSITDDGKGVDAATVTVEVNGNLVYTGNTTDYGSSYGHCRRTGTSACYRYFYQANETFDYDQSMTVTVNATDLAGNAMDECSYSFKTEMRSFGENKKVSKGTNNLSDSAPATASDSSGNVWAVWHASQEGSRDIYVGKLAAEADSFDNPVKVTSNDADQYNPVIAVDSADKLYIAWQDNRQGEWDIYVSTSTDGTTWSAERKITDPNSNQTNPVMAIDGSNKAYIAWVDDRNGNNDIYIGSSSNSFANNATSQVTSNTADQSEPALAVDSDNTVYVVWTDARAGTSDIYGADSDNGLWTNVAVVSKQGNQTAPSIAAEASGSVLHLLWVDDVSGDNDIYYASTSGLPGSPLSGSNLVDDDSRADQSAPVLITTGSTGGNLKVFACWQDKRNVAGNNGDTDIYFVQVNSGSGTNILVGDDGTNSAQSDPAIGIDGYRHPYLIWTDGRSVSTDIYYAGNTFVEPTALESKDIAASLGETVGKELANINSATDVSVIVPAGACSYDVKITISTVKNPQKVALDYFSTPYEFGPSGIEFDQPVTIIIPYDVSVVGNSPSVYWYNSLLSSLSQEGITNIETIQISSSLYALRFKTTHFTQFLVGGIAAAVGGGGGGGGGCSMLPDSRGGVIEFLLPYFTLAVVMVILKSRDRRNRKAHTTESRS